MPVFSALRRHGITGARVSEFPGNVRSKRIPPAAEVLKEEEAAAKVGGEVFALEGLGRGPGGWSRRGGRGAGVNAESCRSIQARFLDCAAARRTVRLPAP